MDTGIARRYTDDIERETFGRYAIASDQARRLDGFESFIYEFRRRGAPYILRVGHTSRRPVDQVAAELDWIDYLAAGGAAVAGCVASSTGARFETIDDADGGTFVAAAFTYAHGAGPHGAEQLIAIAEAYGQAIGRMHALTQAYTPPSAATRAAWDHPTMLDLSRWLPATESAAAGLLEDLIGRLQALPQDDDAYGLVHCDAHGGNFRVDDSGALTFFDFDDCCYTWFANDIAIVLFYAALFRDDPAGFTDTFLHRFLRGYRRENALDPVWLDEMPAFLKLRELGLYAVIHRSFDVDNLVDPWVVAYMGDRRARIEAGAPFLDFDFSSIADALA